MSALTDWLSLRQGSLPPAALEIATNRVCAAAVDLRGARPTVTAHAAELLSAGVVTPSLTNANVKDRPTLVGMVRRMLGHRRPSASHRAHSAGPGRQGVAGEVREGACMATTSNSWSAGRCGRRHRFPSKKRRSASCRARRPPTARSSSCRSPGAMIVKSTKTLCAEAGAHAGLVDLSTFNVINAVLAGLGSADAATGCSSTSPPTRRRSRSCAGRDLIFFRSRGADARRDARGSRPSDGDVLPGPAAGRRIQPRPAVRAAAAGAPAGSRTSSRCAAASKSDWGRRSRPSIRGRRRR